MTLVAGAVACQEPGLAPATTAAELVSPEIAVDSPLPRPGGRSVSIESIAPNDSGFLNVWTEGRQLWASRFGLDGARLQAVSHSLGVEAPEGATVAFGGTGYILAWADEETLWITRLDPAGKMLGSPTMVARVEDDGHSLTKPDIAIAADRLLVVWGVYRGLDGDSVYGQLYDLGLTPLGATIEIEALSWVHGIQVASNGTEFFAVWESTIASQIRGARVTADGIVVDSTALLISPPSQEASAAPAIAYGAGHYLVIWRISGLVGEREIFGRRYTSSGTLLDTEPLEITAGPGSGVWMQVTFDGARFVASWIDERDYRNIYATWIGTDGVIDPPSGVLVHPGYGAYPTASAAVDGVTMVADGGSFTLMDSSQSAIATTLPMAWQYNTQESPAMCATSSGHLIVWKDTRRERGIYAAPLSAGGTTTGPAQRVTSSLFDPIVACGDTVNLVLWGEEETIFAIRVDDAGVPLDAAPMEVAADARGQFAVAGAGDQFLVLWSNGDGYGRRIGSDGIFLDAAPFPITAGSVGEGSPAVAYRDGVYFTAWKADRGVRATRVDRSGEVLDPAGIEISATEYRGNLFVADGEPGFLVGWEYSGDRFVRIVARSGVPLTPATIAFGPRVGTHSVAAWNGTSFSVLTTRGTGGGSEILMNTVNASGTMAESVGVPIAAATWPGSVRPPAASPAGDGKVAIAYERKLTLGDRWLPRIRVREVSFDANGVACSSAAGCASGHCVDGVCCDQACGDGEPGDCQACSVATGGTVDGQCVVLTPTTVCRPAAGVCDRAETCDGVDLGCPSDELEPDGAACTDGDACTTGDACMAGACVSSGNIDCTDPDGCEVGVCDSMTGQCTVSALPDGTTCQPADLCASSGSCSAGACEPGPPISCRAGPCETAACDPESGSCERTPQPDGTPCEGGSCRAGSCVPSPDAGLPDAGSPDAGMPDAGIADAAPTTDARPMTDDRPDANDSSGGCQISDVDSGDTSSRLGWFALLILAIRFSRRRGGAMGRRSS